MSDTESREARARRRATAQKKARRDKRPLSDPQGYGPPKRKRKLDPWCDDYAGEKGPVDYENTFVPLDFHDALEEDDE